ncbi:cellulose biosynthesis protein BcsG [Enterobacter hormaechei]
MKAPHQGVRVEITQPGAIGLSELVAGAVDGKLFVEDSVNWDQLTSGLPQTAEVSENANAVVIQIRISLMSD